MERGLADIEARIAEVEKLREAEDARERRLLDTAAEFYAKQEEIEVAGLAPLLKKLGIERGDIDKFFKAQEDEARRRIEPVARQLQLSTRELELIQREERAVVLMDPCAWVHRSPGWVCEWQAASCDSTPWETANASASCVCDTPNNEWNPRVEAHGQGLSGRRTAFVHCWCYFNIPGRPAPANVTVLVRVLVHGFYVLRAATGSATFSLDVEARGYQYGWSWASATSPVLSLSGDTMGRHDGVTNLQFVMPTGADPFLVRVSAKLKAQAKEGGALAVGDFGTQAGNLIRTTWVNTFSPD
jgi:hypothetical protein